GDALLERDAQTSVVGVERLDLKVECRALVPTTPGTTRPPSKVISGHGTAGSWEEVAGDRHTALDLGGPEDQCSREHPWGEEEGCKVPPGRRDHGDRSADSEQSGQEQPPMDVVAADGDNIQPAEHPGDDERRDHKDAAPTPRAPEHRDERDVAAGGEEDAGN